MTETAPIVFVIDDDVSFRRSTERLISSVGFRVQPFASAADFLRARLPDVPSCIVLDVRMPGIGGLDLQQELAGRGVDIPIIFLSGHADVLISVKAMKAGAVEFLTKPFRDQELLDAINQAINRNVTAREKRAKIARLQAHYEMLTSSERKVMSGVVSGMLNKQIAAELGTSEKTVKFHRAHIMQKMNADSLAELVRMASSLEIQPPRPQPPAS